MPFIRLTKSVTLNLVTDWIRKCTWFLSLPISKNLISYGSSVLRGKYKVVHKYAYIMAFVDKFAHTIRILLTQQAAGN